MSGRDEGGAGGGPAFPAGVAPAVRLHGKVDANMLRAFLEQLDAARGAQGPIVVELMTEGGDADIGRRMALEIRLLRESLDGTGRRLCFLGKTIVFSAGVTLMAAFPAADRYLARDASLLVHERKLDKTVHFFGPLRATLAVARDLIAELENGLKLEQEGFADLIRGTGVSAEELARHTQSANWYLGAEEALRCGLVAGLV